MKVNDHDGPDFDAWAKARISKLPPARREKVAAFVEDMKLSRFSQWTIKANVQALLTLGLAGKPYEQLTREDLTAWLKKLEDAGYSAESLRSYRVRTKRFLRWVHGCRSVTDPSPEVLKIIRIGKTRNDLPKDILTVAEVQKLLAAASSQRNRALIHVCYEGGLRASEALTLKARSLEFDQSGAVAIVDGKTGQRRVRLLESVRDLQLLLAEHPKRDDPEAFVFASKNDTHLTVERFNCILKETSRKVGITKSVHCHLLRHTRATHLASVLTEAQLRTYFGWTRASKVPARYVHLSGRDCDETLLKHYGLARANGPKACPRCGLSNSPEAIYCARCASPLTAEKTIALEEMRAAEEAILAKVLKHLIEKDPSLMNQILDETGARKEIEALNTAVTEWHKGSAGDGIRTHEGLSHRVLSPAP